MLRIENSFAAPSAATVKSIMDHDAPTVAFGSGPLATVIQDLLSIVIHFGFVVKII